MICYKDRTYCAAKCANKACYRYMSEEDWDVADRLNLPVALFDFSEGCEEYIPLEEENE